MCLRCDRPFRQLRELLSNEVIKNGGQDINLMIWMSRVALECVGQGGLGYSFDALDETKVNRYNEIIKMLRLGMFFITPDHCMN